MADLYSRVASCSLIKEVTANVALTPTTYIPILEEDIATEYGYTPSTPVAANRALNLRAIKNKIPGSVGTITINVEPNTIGHFLNSLLGGFTSGNYMPITADAGLVVGDVITGGTSSKTATIAAIHNSEFLILTGASGEFTDTEQITGGTSGKTATVTEFDTTVYGHLGTLPDSTIPTYTLQINYADSAIRYMGVRFNKLDALGQADNIMTAGIGVMAQSAFRHAKVTAITTAGAGAKTISMDQTLGLVAADTIKLYRPGTGFIAFPSAAVYEHTVATVATSTTITVTNLETSTAVGDLIVLAPQTASYTLVNELCWIGGATVSLGADINNFATEEAEDFTALLENEFEERHGASGADFKDRFPTAMLQKGCRGSGSFTAHYQNEDFYRLLRLNTAQAFRMQTVGDQIGTTGMENELAIIYPQIQFDPYETNITQDDMVNEEIGFSAFYNSTQAYLARMLLVNGIASY